MGGRAGGVAGRVLPGNSERGRGVTLASVLGRLEWRLICAGENQSSHHGASGRAVIYFFSITKSLICPPFTDSLKGKV